MGRIIVVGSNVPACLQLHHYATKIHTKKGHTGRAVVGYSTLHHVTRKRVRPLKLHTKKGHTGRAVVGYSTPHHVTRKRVRPLKLAGDCRYCFVDSTSHVFSIAGRYAANVDATITHQIDVVFLYDEFNLWH